VEFRLRRKMRISGQERHAGEVITLEDALGALPHSLYSGEMEAISIEEPISEDFILALRDARIGGQSYLKGQLVSIEGLSLETIERCVHASTVMHITDDEVFKVEKEKKRCEDDECNALFVSRDAKKRHKEITGHKRRYKKRNQGVTQE